MLNQSNKTQTLSNLNLSLCINNTSALRANNSKLAGTVHAKVKNIIMSHHDHDDHDCRKTYEMITSQLNALKYALIDEGHWFLVIRTIYA